jgi:hypothetical protein
MELVDSLPYSQETRHCSLSWAKEYEVLCHIS